MKKAIAMAATICCMALPGPTVPAATVQLNAVVPNGSDFTFTYGGTLSPTEGVRSGASLVILDFAGYIDGSIAAASSLIAPSVELVTPGLLLAPGISDNPALGNLVFTYTGADFRTTPAPAGSPYAPVSFTGLSARSSFGGIALDGFSVSTVTNDGPGAGTDMASTGLVGVAAAVPEPETWAMMILGLGTVGFAMRRRPNARISFC